MKKIFLYCLMVFTLPTFLYAQEKEKVDSIPEWVKNPTIPSFDLLQLDSIHPFSKDSLPKNRPIVIIYFSPDCSHCQYEAKEIVKKADSLKNIFFLWVSYSSLSSMKEFYTKYGLDKLPNMQLARDPKYFLPAYYKVRFTPYMAVYNKKGKYIKEYREGAKITELIAATK